MKILLLALFLFPAFAGAQNKQLSEDAKRERVENFCLATFHETINKKAAELTVKQSKAIPACGRLGLYREKPSFEEALEQFRHLPDKSIEDLDREEELRNYLLRLIPAPVRTKSKTKASQ